MPKFRVTAPNGHTYDVEGPEGSTEQDALAQVQQQVGSSGSSPPKDAHPRWDIIGDIERSASSSYEAMKSDFSQAFPSAEEGAKREAENEEKYGFGGAFVASNVDHLKQMGHGLKGVMDALGIIGSPITGALHATVGSALSYLPGISKEEADRGVDESMMGLAPTRGMLAAKGGIPKIPADYNILRDTHHGGVDEFGIPKGDEEKIPSTYDPARDVERASRRSAAPYHEEQIIPEGYKILGDETPVTGQGVFLPAAKARRAGYVLPPRMIKKEPGVVSDALSAASGRYKIDQAASVKNQPVTNRLAAQELGLPDNISLSPKVFDAFREKQAGAYRTLVEKVPKLTTNKDFRDQVGQIGGRSSAAAKDFPEYMNNPDTEKLVEMLKNTHQVSTQATLDLISELRKDANNNLKVFGADGPKKHAYGLAQREAADALESLIEHNIAEAEVTQRFDPRIQRYVNTPDPQMKMLARAFRDARTKIAQSHDIEGATDSAGNVNAIGLAKLQRKGRPLSGKLQEIAEAADNFEPAMRNPSSFGGKENMSVFDFFGNTMAVSSHHPVLSSLLLMRQPARAAALSKTFQNSLVKPPLLTTPERRAFVSSGSALPNALSPEQSLGVNDNSQDTNKALGQ